MRRNAPMVCFDLGNVLVELGPGFSSQVPTDCKPRLTPLLESYSLGQLSTRVFFERIQGFMMAPLSPEALQNIFIHTRLLGLRDGSEALVDDLLTNGFELAVLSNINEAHWRHLKQFTIFRGFQHFFLSFQLGVKKPHTEFYELVEFETMRSGSDIIFFDDREENVSSARRCGWNAIQVSPENASAGMRRSLVDLGLL